MLAKLKNWTTRFSAERKGAVAVNFAITALPLIMVSGFAIDYGSMSRSAVQLQAAVDSAALQAANASTNRETIAAAVVAASLADKGLAGSSTAQGRDAGSGYRVTGTIQVNTIMMQVAGIKRVTITRQALAAYWRPPVPGVSDNSCIFTLGAGLEVTDDATTFNGSPSVNLSGCSIRSNRSMKCNGHDTGALASYAVGTITGCANPNPGVQPVPDIYAGTGSNIDRQCGTSTGGASWAANGAIPTSGNIITVDKGTHTEVHVCGDLNLSGVGTLTGLTPDKDTVIIVENGQVNLGDNAVISANRSTIVLAGGEGSEPIIQFPDGNGKAATLNVSAGSNADSPWKGYAIYQNPAITEDVDMTLKPGANLMLDGIAYFPNAKITMQGRMLTGSSGCAKVVSSEFVLNGTVDLHQTAGACETLGVAQHQSPGTPAQYSYLLE